MCGCGRGRSKNAAVPNGPNRWGLKLPSGRVVRYFSKSERDAAAKAMNLPVPDDEVSQAA